MNTYTPVNWEDSPSVVTPLDAEHLNLMDEGIANAFEDIGTLDTNAKTEAAKVTQAQADINNLSESVDELQIDTGTLKTSVRNNTEEIAKKANTDDVYTVKEADEHFLSKPDAEKTYLQKSDGAVETSNIAAKAVTTEKIAAGAVTSTKISNNAVGTSNIADYSISNAKLMSNSVSTEKIVDGAVTLAKLGTDVNAKFDSKYDTSNIESGSGTLTTTDTDKISSATFEYQKVNDYVTIIITLTSATKIEANTQIVVSGIPFVNKSFVTAIGATPSNSQFIAIVKTNSADVTVIANNVIATNTKLSTTISYKIK